MKPSHVALFAAMFSLSAAGLAAQEAKQETKQEEKKFETKGAPPVKEKEEAAVDLGVVEPGAMGKYQVILPGGQIVLPPPEMNKAQEIEREQYRQMPLTPQEIMKLRRQMLELETSKAKPIIEPKIRTRAISVSLEAGHEVPQILIAPGNVASLAIVDSLGQPWPLADGPVVGDQESYLVHVSPQVPNVVNIAANRTAGASTLSLLLEGQSVPLIVRLLTSHDQHDARVDLMMPMSGPRSTAAVRDAAGASIIPASVGDETMLAFVQGVPPKGAKEVRASSPLLRAWVMGETLFIRTIASLVSPAWDGESHGAAGVNVYRLPKTPFILISDGGNIQTVQLVFPVED